MAYSIYRPVDTMQRVPSAVTLDNYEYVGEVEVDVVASTTFQALLTNVITKSEIQNGLLCVEKGTDTGYVLTPTGKWAEVVLY